MTALPRRTVGVVEGCHIPRPAVLREGLENTDDKVIEGGALTALGMAQH